MSDVGSITIIGQPGELDWYQYLQLEELQRQREEEDRRRWEEEHPALAPPTVPLVPVEPPPPPVLTPPVRVPILTTVGTGLLRGLMWFLVPQPTGPREHDELDPFDVIAPPLPPSPPPPAATDPIMPPNWNDMVEWPGTPTYVPITPINLGPVEMPSGEPEFIVSPPKVTPRPPPDEINFPNVVEVPDLDYGFDLRPGPAPTPTSTPGSNPDAPGLDEHLEPIRVPQPDRPGTTTPDLFSPTLPDDIRNPFADPFTPSPVPSPPSTQPRAPTIPDFFAPDSPPDLTFEPILPLTQFKPDPFTTKDQCDCAKKKKKKKREDRKVCYRGTYTETKRGLSKKRLEEVPCDAPKRSTGSTKPATKKLKPGQFPGMGLVGGMNGSDIADLATSALKEFAPIVMDYIKRRTKKVAAPKKKRNRKPKTKLPTLPGTPYSTPFPLDFGG